MDSHRDEVALHAAKAMRERKKARCSVFVVDLLTLRKSYAFKGRRKRVEKRFILFWLNNFPASIKAKRVAHMQFLQFKPGFWKAKSIGKFMVCFRKT